MYILFPSMFVPNVGFRWKLLEPIFRKARLALSWWIDKMAASPVVGEFVILLIKGKQYNIVSHVVITKFCGKFWLKNSAKLTNCTSKDEAWMNSSSWCPLVRKKLLWKFELHLKKSVLKNKQSQHFAECNFIFITKWSRS